MTSISISDLADLILADRNEQRPFRNMPISSLDEAYEIQELVAQKICAARSTQIAGYKVGLTNPASQKLLASTSPAIGRIFADRVYKPGTSLKASSFGNLILELELCLRIGRDLPAQKTPYDTADLSTVIDAMAPAVECVDNRNCAPGSADLASMVADNAWGAAAIICPFTPFHTGINNLKAEAWRNGTLASSASTAEVLGSPINSVVWLANHLSSRGLLLKAGDIVLTGAIINLGPVAAGNTIRFSIDGMSAFEITVTH